MVLDQLIQRWKLSDPQEVLSLLIFKNLEVLHLVITPIIFKRKNKIYKMGPFTLCNIATSNCTVSIVEFVACKM